MIHIEKTKLFFFTAKCHVRFEPAIATVTFYRELSKGLQLKKAVLYARDSKPTFQEQEAIENIVSELYTLEQLVQLINHLANRDQQRVFDKAPLTKNLIHKVGFAVDEYLHKHRGNIREDKGNLHIL